MAVFYEIFGRNLPPLGDDCRPDYDRRPRPDIAFNRQRGRAWEASEEYRKSGDMSRAISAALLVLCYDGMGRIRFDIARDKFRLSAPLEAYGIFRSLRTRLKKSQQTLADIRPQFEDEASALLAFLPPLVAWPTKVRLWKFIEKGMADVS